MLRLSMLRVTAQSTVREIENNLLIFLLVEHLCNSKSVCRTGYKIGKFCLQWQYDGAQEKENVLARISLSLADLFGQFEI